MSVDCCVSGGVAVLGWRTGGVGVSSCALRSGGIDLVDLNGAVAAVVFCFWILDATPDSAPSCSCFGNLLFATCSCELSVDLALLCWGLFSSESVLILCIGVLLLVVFGVCMVASLFDPCVGVGVSGGAVCCDIGVG